MSGIKERLNKGSNHNYLNIFISDKLSGSKGGHSWKTRNAIDSVFVHDQHTQFSGQNITKIWWKLQCPDWLDCFLFSFHTHGHSWICVDPIPWQTTRNSSNKFRNKPEGYQKAEYQSQRNVQSCWQNYASNFSYVRSFCWCVLGHEGLPLDLQKLNFWRYLVANNSQKRRSFVSLWFCKF